MKNNYKNKSLPLNSIFNKLINKNYKLIPFNSIVNKTGNTKYFPSISKEWKNSLFFYNNNNNIKNTPLFDISIYNLIKGYFNLYFNFMPLNKYRLKRIYLSKTEIKHTNSKAILTIYTYNKEKAFLIKKIKMLEKSLLNKIYYLLSKYNDNMGVSKVLYSKSIKFLLYKEFILLKKYKYKLNLNLYKFEDILLYKIKKLISKFFNKKVEFNIVNLKALTFNSDIFTNLLGLKLRKKNANTIKIMNILLSKTRFPEMKSIREKMRVIKTINWELIENNVETLNINYLVTNKLNLSLRYSLLNKLFSSFLYKTYNNLNFIFNNIKYKNIRGIRLEAKGRLTKRYRADRARHTIKLKGGLRNMDSSYKGLSSVNFRGYAKSNVEYSIFTSKRRIGAFASKGWISGK